ncbi:hypothetical protein JM18_004743 [Phytophthora kernoviae]|uniref:Uncharacterized protein n=1 Tax=Phytophthora kernoviae TaxID=325452 RepID=A0A922ALY6_9STRA|nr:hypothetical protein JM18_004743 [Phytophthora kernoviae]
MRRVHFRDDVDDDAEIVELHPLLQWDMEAILWLVQQKEVRQPLSVKLDSTDCKRVGTPMAAQSGARHGISSSHSGHFAAHMVRVQGVQFVFITMVPEFGFPYFWICIGNLLAVGMLQYLASTPRPIDLYHPLWQSVMVQLLFVFIVMYIACCKLLLATRFISQVLGSWLMGFTGILIGNHGHVVVKSYKLTRGYSIAAIVALLVLAMIVLGMWIENNDSSLMGIPKQDFMEVFTNILNSDATNPAPTPQIAVGASARVHQLPSRQPASSTRQRASQRSVDDEDGDEEVIAGKKDSFYFLIRGMRARQQAARQAS